MKILKEKKSEINFFEKENSLLIKSRTKRLTIKSYEDTDFETALSLYGNAELTRFFDHGRPRTVQEIQEYISSRGPYYFRQNKPFGIFVLFLQNTKQCIGHVDLVPTNISGELEIGWILHKEFQGQGFCSEAVLNFLIPLINLLKSQNVEVNGEVIRQIMATAHPQNLPSNKLIAKAGLKFYKLENRYGGHPRNWYRLKLEMH